MRKNISISDREISFLGKKFIVYLAIAHRASSEGLKNALQLNGGFILHLDGTCEKDSPHLIVGLDEISKLVLDSIKLPSEKSEELIPFLSKLKDTYGNPVALVMDMGKGLLLAVKKVFPDIKVFICHFHFLRDIGKDLFEAEYLKIKNHLKTYKIRTSLRMQAKVLGKEIKGDIPKINELGVNIENNTLNLEKLRHSYKTLVYILIHWALDTSSQLNGYGFPFDCNHFVFYKNLKILSNTITQLLKRCGLNKDSKILERLQNSLKEVLEDKKLCKTVDIMEEKLEVFQKLRQALKIAQPDSKKGLNDNGEDEDIKTIENKVKNFLSELKSRDDLKNKQDYEKLITQIEKYWDKLFADPILVKTQDGEMYIQPQRTNNILEQFFRELKRMFRKKSGVFSLNRVVKAILSETPLVKNLGNKEYLQLILNGCQTLEERFSQIDYKIVHDELKKAAIENNKIPKEAKRIIAIENLPSKITGMIFNKVA
mgnify:FL=1